MQAQACLPVMHKLNAKVSLIHRFGNNGVIKKHSNASLYFIMCVFGKFELKARKLAHGFPISSSLSLQRKEAGLLCSRSLSYYYCSWLISKGSADCRWINYNVFCLHYVRHYLQILLDVAIVNGFWIWVLKGPDNYLKEMLKTIWQLFCR